MYKKYLLSLSIIFCLLFSIKSYSQESYKSVDIDSDIFTLNTDGSNMIFSGNVKIKMNNFYATCNKAEVFINQKTKKMEKLRMSGKAKIKKDNSEINADKVIFEPQIDKLYIEGNVKTKIRLEN